MQLHLSIKFAFHQYKQNFFIDILLIQNILYVYIHAYVIKKII